MRIPYKYILGLLLFNCFFALYTPIFGTGINDDAVSYTDEDVQQYNLSKPASFLSMMFSFGNAWDYTQIALVTIFVNVVGIGAALATKNYVYIGVSFFISIITAMFTRFINIIGSLNTTGNIYVTGLITIMSIAIGIMVMFNIVDMFAPAPAP